MTSYYVYYRVEPSRLPDLRDAVQSLFDAIERATGVRGRWMRRRDDPATFMEVYEGVGDENVFESVLARETAAFAIERYTERFVCA